MAIKQAHAEQIATTLKEPATACLILGRACHVVRGTSDPVEAEWSRFGGWR